jgi:hypothetical protein
MWLADLRLTRAEYCVSSCKRVTGEKNSGHAGSKVRMDVYSAVPRSSKWKSGERVQFFVPQKSPGQHPLIRMCQSAVLLATIALLAIFAFTKLFTTFPYWDDEGYFLQAYRDFLSGHALYTQVFSFYGPLTFYTAALLARFSPGNLTHDFLRWVTLPVWIGIAGIMARTVWNWTRGFAVSTVVLLLVGFRLQGLAKGIGHPQLWILLAVAILLWLGLDWTPGSDMGRRAFSAGVVLATIVLFKINIGLLVFIAFGLAVSLQSKERWARVGSGLLVTGAAVCGLALFVATPTGSEKWFATLYLVSVAATVAVAMRRTSDYCLPAGVVWISAGFASFLSIATSAALAIGIPVRTLVDGTIISPFNFSRSSHNPFLEPFARHSILFYGLSAAAALGVIGLRRLAPARAMLFGLLKTAAAAALLLGFWRNHRIALAGSLTLLWLVLVDVPPLPRPAYSNRLLLTLLAALFSLELFPMAGEQVDWAALLPMVAAAVLLQDGVNCLAREWPKGSLTKFSYFATRSAVALLPLLMFIFIGRATLNSWRSWEASPSVNLPGAAWLRLVPGEQTRLTTAVRFIKDNCDSVLTFPGLYSLSIWSGVPPIEEKRISGWPFMFPAEIGERQLRRARQQTGACMVVSQSAYQLFREFATSTSSDALLAEITRATTSIATVQDITLYQPYHPSGSR